MTYQIKTLANGRSWQVRIYKAGYLYTTIEAFWNYNEAVEFAQDFIN